MNALDLPLRAVNRLYRALYRRGILRPQRLPKPVISVGNIAAGGAGKTPAVIAIARHLAARGKRVAILTRGYGRAGEGGIVTEPDAERYGDEPVLMKKHVENAIVIVGANRYENGLRVDCDVYLLDDGFQHLRLHRDLDLVIEASRARWHREGRSALADADVILRRDLRLTLPPTLAGRKVFAFSGLADNEQFFASLRGSGLNVVGTRGFPDHHRYTERDVGAIRREAREGGAEEIVTTEKDAVKLRGCDDILAAGAELILPPDVLARIDRLVP